jgi:ribosomal protein S6
MSKWKGSMLVKKSVPVRVYELTCLAGGGYTTAEVAALQDQITALIGKHKGKVVEVNDWGKKTLAYTIHHDGKAHTEASYLHVVAELPANEAVTLAHELKMKKEIIRSLVVVR